MAALMTSVLDSSTKISEYIAECKDDGHCACCRRTSTNRTTILPSCPDGIRFGLAAIKNIGRGFIQKVMAGAGRTAARSRSLRSFCKRMYGTDLNKRALENLIKCGACDCFGLRRSQLLAHLRRRDGHLSRPARRKNVEGQIGTVRHRWKGDDAPVS